MREDKDGISDYEAKVLLVIATRSWQYVIPGAALNHAIEFLTNTGYLDGSCELTQKGKWYLDDLL